MDDDWRLVVPFIGPHKDDPAFARGVEIGRLLVELAAHRHVTRTDSLSIQIHRDNLAQLEIVAEHTGWRVQTIGYEHDDHWTDVDLVHRDDVTSG
jgi:hypothetical protein